MVHGTAIPHLSPHSSYSAADQDRAAAIEHDDRVGQAAHDVVEAVQSGAYVDLADVWGDIGFAYRDVDLSEVLAECQNLLDGARWRPTPLVEGEIEVAS